MSRLIDLTGMRFGRLVVTGRISRGARKSKAPVWHCICDCGGETATTRGNLKTGKAQSCGCRIKDVNIALRQTHGMAGKHPLYQTWSSMRKRCNCPTDHAYPRYGGRGISVCARWDNFETFIEDVGERPSARHSIDRKDNDGNYEPGNVRWATAREQEHNKATCLHLTFLGRTQAATDWANQLGLNYLTLYYRLKRGWSVDRALGTPTLGKRVSRVQ